MSIKNSVIFQKRELLYFCIQRFLFGFSYSLMIPVIPLYLKSLGLSTLTIGTVMSILYMIYCLIEPYIPYTISI